MANPFDVLGVARNASEAEIKAAFKAKAKEWHPDKHPTDTATATAKFAEISAAYDELKEGKAATWVDPSSNPFGSGHGGFDPFAGFAGGFGSRHGGFVDIDEIMRQFEDQNRRRRGKNDDIGLRYMISLQEAYAGKKARVEYNLRSGLKTVEINIPPGIDHGDRLHYPKLGQDADANLPPGDLFVNIEIIPDNNFLRTGINLVTHIEIDIFQAILGGKTEVTTISGKIVEVSIPRGVGGGQQLRVTGHGMPARGIDGKFGDLIVGLAVKMPKQLTEDQCVFLQAARDAAVADDKRAKALELLRP